ncbi:MAG: hypothetical protein RIC06_25145 [Cyclobacteriaceae bacterium]
MKAIEEAKEAKTKEARELYSTLGIEQASDYDTFNFYHNLNESFDLEFGQESEKKMIWTRLSSTTNLTPTVG